jgi:hypothetical protein
LGIAYRRFAERQARQNVIDRSYDREPFGVR